MIIDRRPLALAATLVLAAFAASCGSSDKGSSDKPASMTAAKAGLSKDCQTGDASDKPLCDCIADKLEASGKTAEQIVDITDEVNKGKELPEINKAAAACADKAAS